MKILSLLSIPDSVLKLFFSDRNIKLSGRNYFENEKGLKYEKPFSLVIRRERILLRVFQGTGVFRYILRKKRILNLLKSITSTNMKMWIKEKKNHFVLNNRTQLGLNFFVNL